MSKETRRKESECPGPQVQIRQAQNLTSRWHGFADGVQGVGAYDGDEADGDEAQANAVGGQERAHLTFDP